MRKETKGKQWLLLFHKEFARERFRVKMLSCDLFLSFHEARGEQSQSMTSQCLAMSSRAFIPFDSL
jgi:hypothetical protein